MERISIPAELLKYLFNSNLTVKKEILLWKSDDWYYDRLRYARIITRAGKLWLKTPPKIYYIIYHKQKI